VNRRAITIVAIAVALAIVGAAVLFEVGTPTFLRSDDRAASEEERPSTSTTTTAPTTTTTTAPTTTTQLPPLPPDGLVAGGRPPQFVTVSFDGAGNLDMLRHWRDVADRGHARFSFFLTGVYLLDQAHKSRYVGPGHGPGASSVGFAKVPDGMSSEQYMAALVQQLTEARAVGHEVGTHYNGHFCEGVERPVGSWNAADWASELDQFHQFAANISPNNGFATPIPSPLDPAGVVGGRTPCLEGKMDVLYPLLAERGHRYDASRVSPAGRWPKKHLGLWSMTLDRIALAGTDKTNLSMDYNLYYAYAGAKEDVDPQRSAEISGLAYQSYVTYFENSYHGNRAPIDLGNHFETWNHSAYSNALERFVLEQCVKPEVRCVPYVDLADWLDARTPEQLTAFETGAFPRLERPAPPVTTAPSTGSPDPAPG
jgi:hypothetical protein